MEKGRQEALRNTLDRQLRRRFPSQVTAEHLHRIDKANSDSLSEWADNLVVASSIEDVFISKES